MTEQHDSTVLQTPKPTPVQLGSVNFQSVLKIACIRTAEVAQTLHLTKSVDLIPKKRMIETA